MIYITNVDLVNDNGYTKFGLILSIRSRYGVKTKFILTGIKGLNSVANLRKTTIYNPNVDLVNDDVYPKFGLILSIRSQDIEKKTKF